MSLQTHIIFALLVVAVILPQTHALRLNMQANGNKGFGQDKVPAPDNMVTVVMLDDTYLNLFQCWAEHFSNNTSHKNLDVVVFGEKALDHVMQFQHDHPGVVRSLQHIVPHCPRCSSSDDSFARTTSHSSEGSVDRKIQWPSMDYQAYFWQVVRERLDKGEHVLHMDLDAISVGDPWAAVAEVVDAADIISPNYGRDAQYALFMNTQATRELVDVMEEQWRHWFDSASKSGKNGHSNLANSPETKPPRPDQMAVRAYLQEMGCDEVRKVNNIQLCKTHTGKPLRLGNPQGVVQNGICDYPEGCRDKGFRVVHSRGIIERMCENHPDFNSITHHA